MRMKNVLARMCDMVLHPGVKDDAGSGNEDVKAEVEALIKDNAVGT